MFIKYPIILIGDGELCKYKKLSDFEEDIECYDIDNFKVYDSIYKELEIYKKDKYCRVSVKIKEKANRYKDFKQLIKEYMDDYEIKHDIETFIKNIPVYPDC